MTPVKIVVVCLSLCLSFSQACAEAVTLQQQPMVAIIIDDLGYRLSPGRESAALPWNLTLSIIPFTPHGKHLAELAHRQGKEVMIHAPMETLLKRPWEAGFVLSMDREQVLKLGRDMIRSVPHAAGLNNHGGSLLTASPSHMEWLMALLAENRLYFIDSRTSADSIAEHAARQGGLASASRDVFLDNTRQPEAIMAQLAKLETIANHHGYAIGIGHPHPETLNTLQVALPAMQQRGIQLVSVSTLLERVKNQNQLLSQKAQPQQPVIQPVN